MHPIRLAADRFRVTEFHLIKPAVNGRGRHVNPRKDQDGPLWLRARDRPDDLTTAGADAARTVNEERQVASKSRGEFGQALRGPTEAEHVVKRHEGECPVGAASAES